MLASFKTILCPIDFSEASYHAAEYGVSFAKLSDGVVVLAHVLHNPTDELFHADGYVLNFEEAKRRAEGMLEELRDKRLGYTKCEIGVEIGDPYEQLMTIAKQRCVDLVVIATHGRSAIEDLVLGSVAEKLIRHSPSPLFVVRRGAF